MCCIQEHCLIKVSSNEDGSPSLFLSKFALINYVIMSFYIVISFIVNNVDFTYDSEYDPHPLLLLTKRRRTLSTSESSEPRISCSNIPPSPKEDIASAKRGPGRPSKADRLTSVESVGDEDVFTNGTDDAKTDIDDDNKSVTSEKGTPKKQKNKQSGNSVNLYFISGNPLQYCLLVCDHVCTRPKSLLAAGHYPMPAKLSKEINTIVKTVSIFDCVVRTCLYNPRQFAFAFNNPSLTVDLFMFTNCFSGYV